MRALVLSGGGSRGAYQVGIIKALAEHGHQWDAIYGISVGALNAALMAHYKNHIEGAAQLEKFWLDLKGNSSVYTNWWCGPLGSFFYGGIYNTKPLRKIIMKNLSIDKILASDIKLRIGAVCLETGEYVVATENTPELENWIMASSAFPVAFPPEKINNYHWLDGGVRNIVPLADAIGAHPETIDVVLASPVNRTLNGSSFVPSSALSVGARCIDIMSDEILANDVFASTAQTFIWCPPNNIPLQDPLSFKPAEIIRAIEAGYQNTKKILSS